MFLSYHQIKMILTINIPDFIFSPYSYFIVVGGLFTAVVAALYITDGMRKWYVKSQLTTIGIIAAASLVWPISIPYLMYKLKYR